MLPKVLDGTFYSLHAQNGDNIDGKCTECDEIRKGQIGSTGNFISHYKKMHPTRVKEMEDYLKSAKNESIGRVSRQPSLEESFVHASSSNVCVKLTEHRIMNVNYIM